MTRYYALTLILLAAAGCKPAEPRVVLYSAQDQEFAEPLFEEFHHRTGLTIVPKYDTEAKKTVGLLTELISEKQRPRCDVFWNNEPVGTARLASAGLLEPYESPERPQKNGTPPKWYEFAERARVLVVNTELVPEKDRPRSLFDLTDPRWRGRVVMAVPLYGTTATQASCLAAVLGMPKAKEYYLGLKANGVQLAPGNKQVAEWVGAGRTPAGAVAAVGVADTDDAIAEVAAGHPVEIIFPDQNSPDEKLGTLFLPNTLCILKGCPHPEAARKLVDYLLTDEVSVKLAESEGRQFPPRSLVEQGALQVKLPPALAPWKSAKRMQVSWSSAADQWEEMQKFLAAEIVAP
jgi:iron(III) transport system substrate-binding protein